MPYVRKSFWAGETFRDLADAQPRAVAWCRDDAGMRIHGTTQARPLEVFRAEEAAHPLLPVYDDDLFTGLRHQPASPFPPHSSPSRGAAYNTPEADATAGECLPAPRPLRWGVIARQALPLMAAGAHAGFGGHGSRRT